MTCYVLSGWSQKSRRSSSKSSEEDSDMPDVVSSDNESDADSDDENFA